MLCIDNFRPPRRPLACWRCLAFTGSSAVPCVSSFTCNNLLSLPPSFHHQIPSKFILYFDFSPRCAGRSVLVKTRRQLWRRMSLLLVKSQTRLQGVRRGVLVGFDRNGPVKDGTFQGGVSSAWWCCAGKCWIDRSADTSQHARKVLSTQPCFYESKQLDFKTKGWMHCLFPSNI